MSDQPNTSDNGDRVAVPFLPALRKELGLRLR
jgi:type IV secretion system protein VirB9